MKPLIKWPGGKTRELKNLIPYFPAFNKNKNTFFSPFVGGGAVFFKLSPKKAYLNDIDSELIHFYQYVKSGDIQFFKMLTDLETDWNNLNSIIMPFLDLYETIVKDQIEKVLIDKSAIKLLSIQFIENLDLTNLKVVNKNEYQVFVDLLVKFMSLKIVTTLKIEKKQELRPDTNRNNLETIIKSSYFTFIRDHRYNPARLIKKYNPADIAYFYITREFCFGSMFRFNSEGRFNIPYGGIDYNKKNISKKIEILRNLKSVKIMGSGISFSNLDFKNFLNQHDNMIENDFAFFDPPYDSDFSEYAENTFSKEDQKDLAELFANLKCKALLVIKKTPFITSLYSQHQNLNIYEFEKQYTYNIRGRNEREVTHLLITNYKPSTLNDFFK